MLGYLDIAEKAGKEPALQIVLHPNVTVQPVNNNGLG